MATVHDLIEANKRGLLAGPKKQDFDEAVKRGLITLPTQQPAQQQQQAPIRQPFIEQLSIEELANLPAEEVELLSPQEKQRLLTRRLGALSPAEKALFSFGGGLAKIGRGVSSLAAQATGDEEKLTQIEQQRQFQKQVGEEFRETQPIITPVAEFAGELAGTAIAPVTRAATLPVRAAQTAGTAAAIGAVEAAAEGDDVIEGALIGLGFGATFQGLTEAGRGIARKIINAKGGKFSTPEIEELAEVAKNQGVELFADDALEKGFLSRVSILAEKIPAVGTSRGRRRQAQQLESSATTFARVVGKDIGDFAIGAQKGIQRRLATIKKRTGILFDDAAKELDPLGNIPTTKLDKAIEDNIAKELSRTRRAPDKNLIDLIESFKGDARNFTSTKSLRSDIGDELSEFYKGNRAAIPSRGAIAIADLKRALDEDIEGFVKNEGGKEGLRKFRLANKFFQNRQVPFLDTQLSNLTNTKEPEKIISFILATSKGARKGFNSRANLLFKSMDSEGRDAVRGGIINHAFEKATTGGRFSAQKFGNALGEFEDVTDIFFKGSDKTTLKGMEKLFRATHRATQVAENPPTGARLLEPGVVVGLGVASGLGSTIASIGGFGAAITAITQSNIGKNLLLGLNKTTENTKAREQSLQKINDFLTRSAITGEG